MKKRKEPMNPGQTVALATEIESPLETLVNGILDRMRDVPDDVMRALPEDGASQHDHYIYGWPKKRE
ncbi:MAG TPA: hypothetical protein VMT20_25095 [Terriglobia bacterium]|nr:hypothetical protein [Terriglobia bacterium]